MNRIVVVSLAAATLLGSACAHESTSSTTTVTGSTSTGRSTSARLTDDAASRLARELCAREAACNHVRQGARYRSEEACMADQTALAPAQLARWGCTPGRTRAGFEECLAAVRSERCETPLPRVDILAACRSAAVCAAKHD